MNYDKTNLDSIYNYAIKLKDKTFLDVINSKTGTNADIIQAYSSLARKGGLGNLLEELYFEYQANSDQAPDFAEVGMELKVTPYEIKNNGEYRAGERLVITMIDYKNPVEKDFYLSHAWQKMARILLIYYLRDRKIYEQFKSNLYYKIKFVNIFTPPKSDLSIIKHDYVYIIDKIEHGEAHLLSEADTMYLGACTKGADRKSSMVPQFYNKEVLAPKRAFCFKTSYMTFVLNHYIIGKESEDDSLLENDCDTPLSDILIERAAPYKGKSLSHLIKYFELGQSKSAQATVIRRILGVKSNKVEEFEKANIIVKTIRVEENGSINEHFRLNDVVFKRLAKEEVWEESELYDFLQGTQILFFIYKKKGDDYIFRGCQLWHMPVPDLDIVGDGWTAVRDRIREGVIFTPEITKSGGEIMHNNLPSTKDNPLFHIRPHASKKYYVLADGSIHGDGSRSDGDELPDGQIMPRHSYWLSKSYILKQLDKNIIK